jgi:hypothetical protein
MAPCTYVRLALSTAPDGRIRFGSLEFTDIDGPAPVNSILPGQALRFGDLDFVTDHLGQLRLSEEKAATPYISIPDHRSARAGPAIVNSDVLACRIDACLGTNPKPKLSQHVFYVLANAFAQLSRSGTLSPEAEFWKPSTMLPSEMRDAIALFGRELARRDCRSTMPESSRFVGMLEQDLESIYDLLLATLEKTDSKSDSMGSCHPLRECNMLHLLEDGVAPTEDVEDDAYPIPRTPREQATYNQEHLEQDKAREVDQADERRDDGCLSP